MSLHKIADILEQSLYELGIDNSIIDDESSHVKRVIGVEFEADTYFIEITKA